MIDLLLAALDEAYDRKSWHGPNLRGSLRALTADDAVWRPQPARHNIQEIAVHAAYWKYVVRRKITGGRRGSFALPGSNWFPRHDPDSDALRRDLALLTAEHHDLQAVVSALSTKALRTQAHLIRGAAAHDIYHAGQIQLLKKLRADLKGMFAGPE